jgi:hypothetical protein
MVTVRCLRDRRSVNQVPPSPRGGDSPTSHISASVLRSMSDEGVSVLVEKLLFALD